MDLWNSKDIVNLWTVLHFCFGLLVASLSYLAGIELVLSLSIASALAVIWEIYERLHGTGEFVLNSIFDFLGPTHRKINTIELSLITAFDRYLR